MKKLFLIIALGALFSSTAWATEWYIYDGAHQICEQASSFAAVHGSYFADPYDFRLGARMQPGYEGMRVTRFGKQMLVDFKFSPETSVVYASSRSLCNLFAEDRAKVYGDPNLNELK